MYLDHLLQLFILKQHYVSFSYFSKMFISWTDTYLEFWGNISRTQWRNCPEYGMMMCFDHLQKWSDFGHAPLIFLFVGVLMPVIKFCLFLLTWYLFNYTMNRVISDQYLNSWAGYCCRLRWILFLRVNINAIPGTSLGWMNKCNSMWW